MLQQHGRITTENTLTRRPLAFLPPFPHLLGRSSQLGRAARSRCEQLWVLIGSALLSTPTKGAQMLPLPRDVRKQGEPKLLKALGAVSEDEKNGARDLASLLCTCCALST